MARQITLKAKDIRDALAIKPSQFRTWVDTLPPHSNAIKKERSAVKYDPADLMYFLVIKHIINTYGISIHALANVTQDIYSFIREPQSINDYPLLFISFIKNTCSNLPINKKINAEGIIINLQPIQEELFQFLGVFPEHKQSELQLGLTTVVNKCYQKTG